MRAKTPLPDSAGAMIIRPATKDDRNAIWAILEPIFRAGDTYAIDPAISRDDALAYWTAHQAFVADMDGETLGTFYIRPNQQGGGSHICNCGYATAPRAQGKGVARAMLAHSLTQARTAGYEAMQFNFVLANNTRAVDTWLRAGFTQIGRIPRAFKHPTDGYVDALVLYRELR